jgi:predicted outer membrane repeat protein
LLHIITKVFLTLKSSTFLNGYSKLGGALALTGSSSITIDACTFSNNFAQEHGGALYLSRFDTLSISGGQTVFTKNLAKISGSDVYAVQSEGSLIMVGTQIDNMQGANSVQMEGVKFRAKEIKVKRDKR